MKNDFIWNLVNQNYDSFADMAQQALRLDFDLNLPYTCIALKTVPKEEDNTLREYSAASTVASTAIETMLIHIGQQLKCKIMVAARSLNFIIFLENYGLRPADTISRFIDDAEKELTNTYSNYTFYWGISEISAEPPVFHRLYQNASMALQYCLTSPEQKYRFTYQDTKQAEIISVLSNSETAKRIAKEIMEPLLEYDANSDINLVGTVIAFLKCNYNISLTARTLFIHRQSLLYRLEKIEDLTGMSLNNHQDLFLLEICTHIYFNY